MSIEAMKQMVEALEKIASTTQTENLLWWQVEARKVLPIGRQAIARAEGTLEAEKQELVAEILLNPDTKTPYVQYVAPLLFIGIGTKLYTHPQPKREWIGLTDEEREELMENYDVASPDYAKAIESKLKEKNT